MGARAHDLAAHAGGRSVENTDVDATAGGATKTDEAMSVGNNRIELDSKRSRASKRLQNAAGTDAGQQEACNRCQKLNARNRATAARTEAASIASATNTDRILGVLGTILQLP